MSKGKYKRQKEHAQQRAKQEGALVPALRGVVYPKPETETRTERKQDTNDKEERSMRFSERIKSSSLTDWLLTLFTAVLAAAAIYQFIIMGGQLDTMRKDQRAWVSIIQKGPIVLNVGVTPSEVVTISNTGKLRRNMWPPIFMLK